MTSVICVLGGGSVWTPELVRQLSRLPIELVIQLHGPTADHLLEVARFARQISDDRVQISTTTDLTDAVCGAQLILNQARIGGWTARLEDETVSLQTGFVGDESLGLGGLRAALRAKPMIAHVASIISKCANDAWLINISNPSDLVTRLWRHYGCTRVLSLCSDAQMLMKDMASLGDTPELAFQFGFAGFSHIGWLTPPEGFDLQAVLNIRPQLKEWVEEWNAIPTPWRIHYSDPEAHLLWQQQQPVQRGGQLKILVHRLRDAIRTQNNKLYKTLLAQREPIWYSEVVVPAIRALLADASTRLVVGLPNNGKVLESDPGVQVESWAIVNAHGAQPEPLVINKKCLDDLKLLAKTRSLAFAAILAPTRNTLESYVKSDALLGDRAASLEWHTVLPLTI